MNAQNLILICIVAFVACSQPHQQEERIIDSSDNRLFIGKCASCHNPFKDATGPALREITNRRSQEWIFKFVTNRKSLSKDTAYLHLMKTSKIYCPEFPDLTKEEVQRIFKDIH